MLEINDNKVYPTYGTHSRETGRIEIYQGSLEKLMRERGGQQEDMNGNATKIGEGWCPCCKSIVYKLDNYHKEDQVPPCPVCGCGSVEVTGG